MKSKRIAFSLPVFCLAWACLALPGPAQAQQDAAELPLSPQATVEQFVARYPKDSIDSVAKADGALQQAASARALLDAQYAADERACYSRFFTNACIGSAKERQRHGLGAIRPVELEASGFKRKARVQQRDDALAERQAREQTEARDRQKLQLDGEQLRAQREAERARKMAEQDVGQEKSAGSADDRVRQHEEKLKKLREEEAAGAPQRAKNIADYQEKVRQAAERQKEMAARQAKKQAEKEAVKPANPVAPTQ